ncbi:MAG TPA: ABC transporter permease, partial [Chryseosolibacter sp.]|nr:ABC transporter permease [Chryseosolibacter sp.]
SRSALVTSIGEFWGTQLIYKTDSVSVYFNTVNEHYIPVHGHKLVAGRNFTARPGASPETEVIINETLLKRLNFQSASAAIGEIVQVEDKPVQIVGVMRDFHYGKVDHGITSVIFRYSNSEARMLNMLVKSNDWPATFEKLEAVWKKFDVVHPLKATFYKEQIERAYNEFSAMIKLMGFLAFLAVSIASIGLLGMVVFTTETRLREISIRKVLGASESNLLFLLSRGFLLLLLIAAMVALPVTYVFFDQVVLANIIYHAPISLTELLISVAIVMAIALLMIGSQTLKVARSNPAEVLKSE